MHSEDSPAGQTVYDEIRAERERQDAQWGGPDHDDDHDPDGWPFLVQEYAQKALRTKYCVVTDAEDGPEYRRRMLQVAALAVAAVEAYDRKADGHA